MWTEHGEKFNSPLLGAPSGEGLLDNAWCWAWGNREAVEWGGGEHEPTCTWRSNILPQAHTGRWRSRRAERSVSCRTPPGAIAAAGSGD